MNTYSGWNYMLIDIANQFGKDKLTFEDRIQWATDNLKELENLAPQAENYPLYMKAVMSLRKVQAGNPTGHMVAFDAVCSGLQLMSVLTGCLKGATATGLVDPNRRADAYSDLAKHMQTVLGPSFHVERKPAKEALMTVLYGSKEQPKKIFGIDTPELNAFYQAVVEMAPGAWALLQDLLASWQSGALSHRWVLPDGFDVRVKVMVDKQMRPKIEELANCSFTYDYYENEGTKKGLSNVANVVHSVDGYVLRCVHRRCNYDEVVVHAARRGIYGELEARKQGHGQYGTPHESVEKYLAHYDRSGIADIVILPHLVQHTDYCCLETTHLEGLLAIIESMVIHTPFEVVTVHDAFAAHPNNLNHLRQHYINVLAELADSDLASDILSQIHGKKGTFRKLSNNLSTFIRGSSYALS